MPFATAVWPPTSREADHAVMQKPLEHRWSRLSTREQLVLRQFRVLLHLKAVSNKVCIPPRASRCGTMRASYADPNVADCHEVSRHLQCFLSLRSVALHRCHIRTGMCGFGGITVDVPSKCPSPTMPFTKLQKNSAYFSRYQVKYKRRRSGKTDYYARKRLITQAKNKYNAPKYRLVIRFTNKDIIAQIVTSELNGDKVFCAAYAHELKAYGVEHGLTNWAAAYCVGLLIARRTLSKLELADAFEGVEEADGEFKLTEEAEVDGESRRPFKCYLDVGLTRTSTGARVFGAMKGASDGGLYIPHSEKRFPGYDIESKELDAETLRKYIFGGHVAEYMETLADDDEERYKSQFSGYIDDEIEADGLEELYQDAHKQIREDPFKKAEGAGEKKTKEEWKAESKKYRQTKLTKDQKMQRVQEKIKALASEM
nr:60s ribosomal protein l5 [Quercus suber]